MEEEVSIRSSVSELRTVNKTQIATLQKNHKHNTVIASNNMAYLDESPGDFLPFLLFFKQILPFEYFHIKRM